MGNEVPTDKGMPVSNRSLAEFLLMMEEYQPIVSNCYDQIAKADQVSQWDMDLARFRMKSRTTIYKEQDSNAPTYECQ
jgi:hypothetical protein